MSLVRARDLHKAHGRGRGARAILAGADLDVPAGQLVAVVGRSGTGKSTLLHLLGALDRPDAGAIELAGQRIDGRPERVLTRVRRRTLGFVFQAFHLVPNLTALENVMLPMEFTGLSRPARRERARELLALVGIEPARQSHRPGKLSGGQQQRVAIARALANDPPVILGDEVTGNLDGKTGRRIVALLQRLAHEGRTVVLVTHDQRIAREADRRIELEDGRLVAEGTAPDRRER